MSTDPSKTSVKSGLAAGEGVDALFVDGVDLPVTLGSPVKTIRAS